MAAARRFECLSTRHALHDQMSSVSSGLDKTIVSFEGSLAAFLPAAAADAAAAASSRPYPPQNYSKMTAISQAASLWTTYAGSSKSRYS